MGDVGLRLVIIVIRNEVFDGVFREEFPEFAAKLGGKRLVMRQHKRRSVQVRDHGGHRKGLARAGHAQKHLLLHSLFQPLGQRRNGLRLVAGGRIRRVQLEFHMLPPQTFFLRGFGRDVAASSTGKTRSSSTVFSKSRT